MSERILVTGGAGYVGSHCTRALVEAGFEVVVADDLSTGYAEAVEVELVRVDLREPGPIRALLARGFAAVLHFAGRIAVGESVGDPLGYYDVNVRGTLNLLDAMGTAGCDALVFSSTAAVYGDPETVPIPEDAPIRPINPYGSTKAAVDRLLAEARDAGQLRSAALRYFNAAGASEDGRIGEAHDPETHLVPLALRAAKDRRPMRIFGTDFPTPDGTCIRDYVHVLDLADAHVLALRHLLEGHVGGAWNVGTGTGASVREVLDTVEAVTGIPLQRQEDPRRAGDPPALVADPTRLRTELGWSPRFALEDAIRTAWRWEQRPRYGRR